MNITIRIEPTIENIKYYIEKDNITLKFTDYRNIYLTGYYEKLIYCCKNNLCKMQEYENLPFKIIEDYIHKNLDISFEEVKKIIDQLIDIGINIEFQSNQYSVLYSLCDIYKRAQLCISDNNIINYMDVFDYVISNGANVNRILQYIERYNVNKFIPEHIEYFKKYENIQTKCIEF